jgi:hypothetical protein
MNTFSTLLVLALVSCTIAAPAYLQQGQELETKPLECGEDLACKKLMVPGANPIVLPAKAPVVIPSAGPVVVPAAAPIVVPASRPDIYRQPAPSVYLQHEAPVFEQAQAQVFQQPPAKVFLGPATEPAKCAEFAQPILPKPIPTLPCVETPFCEKAELKPRKVEPEEEEEKEEPVEKPEKELPREEPMECPMPEREDCGISIQFPTFKMPFGCGACGLSGFNACGAC